MIDGKMANVLTGTRSSMTCSICGCTPRQMNHLQAVSARPAQVERYQLGLSTMHAWIRCFELVIHVAYRLEVKQWQVKTVVDKKTVKAKQRYPTAIPGAARTGSGPASCGRAEVIERWEHRPAGVS